MATKRAKKRAKAKPEAGKEEPFFRPFEKLKPKKTKPPPEPKQAPKRPAKPAAVPETKGASASADAQTFAIYMAGVTALEDKKGTRIPKTASRVERAQRGAPPPDLDAGARDRMRSLVLEGIRFETIDDGDRIEGRRVDVDPRDLRRLRRGQFAIDGKLDLHGLAVEEARKSVEVFVKKRAVDGDQVVVIVHGKGTHSPRQYGVLRGEIGAWLSQGRVARYIRAFATAPEDEGGAGAVLVLLGR